MPLRASGMLCAAMLALVSCMPAQTEPDLSRRFNEETTRMGQIQAVGSLRIGIPTESAVFAFRGKGTTRGFAVAVANLIAHTLGVEGEMVFASSEELLVDAREARLDIAFPLQPLTEKVFRAQLFTDPYYIGHQRLLVPTSSEISSTDDLAAERVCSYTSNTGVYIGDLVSDVQVVEVSDPRRCTRLLEKDKVQAVTSEDVFLMGMMASLDGEGRRYSIVGDQLTTGGYAIAVSPGGGGFVDYLNNVLREAEKDGTWTKLYRRWLSPYSDQPPSPPELTAEEAAALHASGA